MSNECIPNLALFERMFSKFMFVCFLRCPICRKKIIPENWRKLFGIQAKEKLKRIRTFDFQSSSKSAGSSPSSDLS